MSPGLKNEKIAADFDVRVYWTSKDFVNTEMFCTKYSWSSATSQNSSQKSSSEAWEHDQSFNVLKGEFIKYLKI